jgi:hypothetical protein
LTIEEIIELHKSENLKNEIIELLDRWSITDKTLALLMRKHQIK